MNRLAKGLIAGLSAVLIGLTTFTTVVLLAGSSAPAESAPAAASESAPVEQPCPVWGAEQGLTDSRSYDQCFNLWNAGYDTRSITQDEYEWNIEDYRHVFGEDA